MIARTQYVAHRGGAELAPENTLAAFQTALTLPVDAIELDVHMTRDGQTLVIHDNVLERCTDGQGNILDFDFSHLRSLNAAAHFPGGWPERQQIPTLREVLDLARGRVQAYIEIKPSKHNGVVGRYPNIAETVIKEVRDAGMLNDVLVIAFDWGMLELVKSLEPAIQAGALVDLEVWDPQAEHALDTLFKGVKRTGCSWINLSERLFTEDLLEAVHSRGYKLGLWTVDVLEDLRRFAAAGVDSLTSDRPDLFTKL
ncbi:glycerophosphodiester phosphodiesterase [Ktedonosporobacter rubrisoli]|nr:glycerophosphodiester phosphodiesterase family protein [Ktedonosporobacter rubrisoli]